MARAREEIVRQIRAVEKNPAEVDTPISVAVELQSLRRSDNPLEKSNAEIITMLQDIKNTLVEVREEPRRSRMHPAMLEDLVMTYDRLRTVFDTEPGMTPLPEQYEAMRSTLHRLERVIHHLCMESGFPPEIFMFRMRRARLKNDAP